MITKETLEQNRIMQRADDQLFSDEESGKDILWTDADEIIIVEGEMDKLPMNEVGLHNCISVPNGAPQIVSNKELSIEEDVGFQFLWNEKENIEKASRIILATDGDIPVQASAKKLARRVGEERCWLLSSSVSAKMRMRMEKELLDYKKMEI